MTTAYKMEKAKADALAVELEMERKNIAEYHEAQRERVRKAFCAAFSIDEAQLLAQPWKKPGA